MSLNDWKNEKAMLEQRNQFLYMQIQEIKEREEHQKKFNDTIMQAWNQGEGRTNCKVYKEIQSTLEEYSRELIEAKKKSSIAMMKLENENTELKYQIQQLESIYQQKNQLHQDKVMELRKRIECQTNKENVGDNQFGCIVSVKSRTCSQNTSREINKQRSKTQNKPELLNCRNSNVMEINTDFLKEYSTQIESVSPQERQNLAIQLKQLTKELKTTKNEIENTNLQTANELKTEIKSMLNKLLKAKGKMTESIVGSGKESVLMLRGSQYKPTLADFAKQLNAVRSIETFNILNPGKATNNY
ncbi:unnamed protein product [Paramecium sonneborni]|uniref:Uncharacterized protein n=1 Tax=Paramecium sonneborni TaxID=65129 RepID=A0A8S1NDM4_9CILI|nr:unnamed protein product [Paramecium sonneborni]